MRKDNRKVLSPSDLIRGSRLNNKAIMFDVDSRVKPENDSGGDKRVHENDSPYKEDDSICWKVAAVSLCLVVCMGAGEALAQCAVPPTCDALGFNKTADECAGQNILKCPFDQSKVYCPIDYVSNPSIGAIYYSDGTITDSVIAGKTPIGIIAYVNGKSGFVISLAETGADWSTRGYSNLSCLPDLDRNGATEDMNGKSNTACIMSEKSSGNTYPAAEYCNSYKPVSSGKGSTGWYLPAAGELKKISLYYSTLNISLQRLSKTQLSSIDYWSSSENAYTDGYDAWEVSPSNGTMNVYDKTFNRRVRCVLAF